MKIYFALSIALVVAFLGMELYQINTSALFPRKTNVGISIVDGEPTQILLSEKSDAANRYTPERDMHADQSILSDALIAEIASQPETSPVGGRTVRELRRQISLENRDNAWASHAETALFGTLSAIPYLNENVEKPNIRCQATICEIAGSIRQDATFYNK